MHKTSTIPEVNDFLKVEFFKPAGRFVLRE